MIKEYTAPESKLIEIGAEGIICASENYEGASIQSWNENEILW